MEFKDTMKSAQMMLEVSLENHVMQVAQCYLVEGDLYHQQSGSRTFAIFSVSEC